MLFNKKITALVCALLISTASSAFAYTPIGQDYHTPTTREELEDLYSSNELNQANLERSSFLESKIQAPLIKYNSDKLKKATDKYSDGLHDVFLAKTKDIDIGGENFSGHIYLTSGLLNRISQNGYADYNIYGLSAVASVYAHEAGHWYYNDSWISDEQSYTNADIMKQEQRADRFATKAIENVPQFSTGGDLIHAYYSAYEKSWYSSDLTHPENANRFDATYNYIIESSNQRVLFDNDSRATNELLVANKSKTAYYTVYTQEQNLNGQKVASAIDRANYISGQIAWAIKNNCYDSKHITYEDAHKYFKDLPSDISATAIIATANNERWKIIDWYQNDKENTTEKEFLDNLKASYQN